MPKTRELIAWWLIITFAAVALALHIRASRQEGRAEEAERRAAIAAKSAEQAHADGAQRVAAASAVLELKEADIKALKAKLQARLPSEWPSPARRGAPGATISAPAAPEPSIFSSPVESAPSTKFECALTEEKVGPWPVAACVLPGLAEPFGAVPYQAAIRAEELAAQSELTVVKLSAAENELTATKAALVASQNATVEWKKAAKKSRFKRILAKLEKPALVIIGVLIGRASK